ncbi:uncharacterized protein LOC106058838 [Biomphalaria glabrata]|uniref:Uncharacterized protein LOC106058838 n=1 Tax=Biomphalaria glabrata TaxID=6526 RepID=A0A9W2ZFD6_BIOGL|nr:uncharacterized protein LOC106058838 [Biomphalaria glabrata]
MDLLSSRLVIVFTILSSIFFFNSISESQTTHKFVIWRYADTVDLTVYICTYVKNQRVNMFCPAKNSSTGWNWLTMMMTTCRHWRFTALDSAQVESNRSYCVLQSPTIATVYVTLSKESIVEQYLVPPVSVWRTEYYVLNNLAGMIVVTPEREVTIEINVIANEEQLSRDAKLTIKLEKNEGFKIVPCSQAFQSKKSMIAFRLHATQYFGIVTGICSRGKNSQIRYTNLVLPEDRANNFIYFTFCILLLDCILYAFSPFSQPFKVIHLDSGATQSYSSDSNFVKLMGKHFMVESNYFMQVVIMLSSSKDGDTFLCTVLPTHLFQSKYFVMLSNEFKNYLLIILSVSGNAQIIVNKKDLLSFTIPLVSLSNHHGRAIFYVELEVQDTKKRYTYEILSTANETFGCYLYGNNTLQRFIMPFFIDKPEDSLTTVMTPQSTTNPNFTSEIQTTKAISRDVQCSNSTVVIDDKIDNDCDGYVDEEEENNKDDDDDDNIDEDTTSTNEYGCRSGWFGSHCDNMCHCEKSLCLPHGYCQQNRTCEPEYFGQQCLFRDLMTTATVSHTEMKSRHFIPCQHYFTVKSPLIISFPTFTLISWIQIEALSKDFLYGLQVHFLETPNQTCYTGPCSDRRDIFSNNYTLIVICNIPSYVCEMRISFDESVNERYFCSVYVSGGRNVALRKPVQMSSYRTNKQGIISRGSLSVDGIINKPSMCATTEKTNRAPSFSISFPTRMVLNLVVIYFADVTLKESKFFKMKFANENNETIRHLMYVMDKRVSIIPPSDEPIKSIKVSLWSAYKTLSICEFEAYGECAPPMYGPDCKEVCSISCVDQLCTYEGFCRNCPNGTRGSHCFERCVHWCNDEENTTLRVRDDSTRSPYQKFTGFQLEHFWYYIMVVFAIISICCIRLSSVPVPKATYGTDIIDEVSNVGVIDPANQKQARVKKVSTTEI